ncbi:hypothetical protein EJ03DRAFT_12934 [Teratosphaeria nubilosa]|uniref:Uncharacterized protein n=1 Tax=Teratosphaeria nubilosa TaxID=161662 RepID=A0A6G1KW76_9PEZI|nr:hypothetical protein EJ03DRAFT_12934 [Teratosphaeria nubilosa]
MRFPGCIVPLSQSITLSPRHLIVQNMNNAIISTEQDPVVGFKVGSHEHDQVPRRRLQAAVTFTTSDPFCRTSESQNIPESTLLITAHVLNLLHRGAYNTLQRNDTWPAAAARCRNVDRQSWVWRQRMCEIILSRLVSHVRSVAAFLRNML